MNNDSECYYKKSNNKYYYVPIYRIWFHSKAAYKCENNKKFELVVQVFECNSRKKLTVIELGLYPINFKMLFERVGARASSPQKADRMSALQ